MQIRILPGGGSITGGRDNAAVLAGGGWSASPGDLDAGSQAGSRSSVSGTCRGVNKDGICGTETLCVIVRLRIQHAFDTGNPVLNGT